jgi:Ca2+:H+ antiporter
MIVCNGLVGLCIFIGGLRYREQDFQLTGANLYLSVLFVLATITLVMPNFTLTAPGPFYSAAQLGFVSVVTVLLYAVFLYTQTIRHRDYFVSGAGDGGMARRCRPHAGDQRCLLLPPGCGGATGQEILRRRRRRHREIGAPPAFAACWSRPSCCRKASRGIGRTKNDLQKSINLALGSSLATIGLLSGGRGRRLRSTAIAAWPVRQDMLILLLTFALSMLTWHRPHQHPVRHGPHGGVCGVRVHGIVP